MAYKALAPLVLAKDQAGRIHYHYSSVNPVIPWLSDEQAEHFLAEGLVAELEDGDAEPADDGKPKRPAKSASKAKWDEYVVAVTADTDTPVTLEEAAATSKDDLITLYGGE